MESLLDSSFQRPYAGFRQSLDPLAGPLLTRTHHLRIPKMSLKKTEGKKKVYNLYMIPNSAKDLQLFELMTAARRNKSFVLSELESVIIQDTILSIRAK